MGQERVSAVVTAKPDKGIEEAGAAVDYTFPDSVAEYVEIFGEEVVKSIIHQQSKIKLQAGMRTHLLSGKSAEEIQAWADNWRPGLAKPKMSNLNKALKATEGMNDEELRSFLSDIKARMKG